MCSDKKIVTTLNFKVSDCRTVGGSSKALVELKRKDLKALLYHHFYMFYLFSLTN